MPPTSLALCLSVAGSTLLAPVPKPRSHFLDLQPQANQPLDATFKPTSFADNHLRELPRGKQTFADVPFVVGKRMIQLNGHNLPKRPRIITIPVGLTFRTLHLLHATGWDVPDGTRIGHYLIRYADDSTRTLPIVYGKDVCDWWYDLGEKEMPEAKVAWEGSNPAAKGLDKGVRLYLTSWHNPRPGKKVEAIEYHSAGGRAAPFCVAITASD